MANEQKDELPTGDSVVRETQALGDRAIDTAKDMADQQKSAGADRIEHVADALRSSAEELGASEEQLAQWVGTAAGQLEGFAKTLREKDLSALMAEMEDFGRRQPAVFMGAAVALGFGIARFAKAGSSATGQAYGTQTAGQKAYNARQSDNQPRWNNDQPGRTPQASTVIGDYPRATNGGADRIGGLHETDSSTGPFHRPQAGS